MKKAGSKNLLTTLCQRKVNIGREGRQGQRAFGEGARPGGRVDAEEPEQGQHLKYLGKTAGPKDLLTTESQNKVNIGSTLP